MVEDIEDEAEVPSIVITVRLSHVCEL